MATYIIIFLLLLAIAVMPVSLEDHFTQEELTEMGIHLDFSSILEKR